MATKTKKPATGKAPPRKAAKESGASTTPIMLHPAEARMVGDQLRGIAYLAKKLALAIREQELVTPFHPDEVTEISDKAYALAGSLRLLGDNGSNGG